MIDNQHHRVLANDFATQWADIAADAIAALERVGQSGWLVLGEEVAAFEREFAAWWGAPHAIGVASGLDALEIGLRLVGVSAGDRVLTTPLTAFATTLAILRCGAEPVWCDVDATGGLDLALADEVLGTIPGITAVVPVHLYGHPLDPRALARLVTRHDVQLVEDCAQSAGATRDGRPTGSIGRVAASSFYPTKNLGALGDGGAVLTRDPEFAERARRLRNYGQREQYHHVELGMNSRLDEVHAAILRSAMLPRLDGWIERRRAVAARYDAALAATALRPIRAGGGQSARHLYPVEVVAGDAGEVGDTLRRLGVAVGRHYPFLCPDMPACGGSGVRVGALDNARRITACELSLPLHPYLTDGDVDRVIDVCQQFLA